MFSAIIVAAGSSRRAGFDKLVAPLGGVAVLLRSIQAFVDAGANKIILVCPQERWQFLGLDDSPLGRLCQRVEGGAQRQDSVQAGLDVLDDDCQWVAVHDGARPLIQPCHILSCLQLAQQTGAAACAHPIVDTLKRANEQGQSLPEFVNRDHLWGMETPQIFDKKLLLQAYQYVREQGTLVTDEVSAVEQLGHPTALISGGHNMKITLPHDLALAEMIWQQGNQS